MKRTLRERIEHGDLLVGDGAWGSMLMDRGLKPGHCPESMVLEQAHVVAEVAEEYVAAGADLIMTDTFGASPIKLAGYNLQDRVDEINRKAVRLLRDCLGDRALVVGSVGPTGAILEPYGDVAQDDVFRGFRMQMEALIGAGVDGICVETMVDVEESKLAIAAARACSQHVPILATMAFEETPRGFFTIMGVSVSQAINELRAAGADAVGANCGVGMETMCSIARKFNVESRLPLIFQANAGSPVWQKGQWMYPDEPEKFADDADGLLDIGVAIVGGCCGTTPAHIRQLRTRVDRYLLARRKG